MSDMSDFTDVVRNFKAFIAAQQYGPALFWLGFMARRAEEFQNYTATQAIANMARVMMASLTRNDPDHERLSILSMESTVLHSFGRK